MPHTRGLTNTTPVHRPINNLLFHFDQSSFVDLGCEKRVLRTGSVTTQNSWLSIQGLPMFHHVSTVTSRALNGRKHHTWRSYHDGH
jgi:hypothetical protein